MTKTTLSTSRQHQKHDSEISFITRQPYTPDSLRFCLPSGESLLVYALLASLLRGRLWANTRHSQNQTHIRIVLLSEEDRNTATVSTYRKFLVVSTWFLRYARGLEDIHAHSSQYFAPIRGRSNKNTKETKEPSHEVAHAPTTLTQRTRKQTFSSYDRELSPSPSNRI